MKFSHLSSNNEPKMVDIGGKLVTARKARAQAVVILNDEIMEHFSNEELKSKKGPVFHAAILAGVMAAKKTHELIPLCHSIPLEDCEITIRANKENRILIDCEVRATHKTGVEMEALTAVSVAALTIYDMCKGISHRIYIESVRLVEKTGGKSNFKE